MRLTESTMAWTRWPRLLRGLASAAGMAILTLASRDGAGTSAFASPPATASAQATFALVIGSNQSVDTSLPPLRYADDDAARYLDLFRVLGARTYLLTRPDENTRRLHPQAAAEAMDPKKSSFDAAVSQLVTDVTRASQRGVETIVYFVYAGHGNVADNGEGYITLEDARITGADLGRVFTRVPATRIHLIADACASYFLAYSRGPGGERRPIDSFGMVPALLTDPRVGLLLSTSSARESHEWDQFQSGVFSHEVRSGLYGAADADGDGQVSYREIAAFVSRANAKVPNERFRPDVHARAPRSGASTDTIIDLRRSQRRLEVDGKHAGRYFLEDSRGVRIADFHNAQGHTMQLVRPPTSLGRMYLRRLDDDKELVVDSAPELVAIATLPAGEPRSAVRGAAHESFNELFALPFDPQCVSDYEREHPREPTPPSQPRDNVALMAPSSGITVRRALGAGLVGAGALSIGTGVVYALLNKPHVYFSGTSQADAAAQNARARSAGTIALGCYIGGGVAIAAGLGVLLWPDKDTKSGRVGGGASAHGGFVTYDGTF